MALWNKDKAFRNDYEKRILASLDMRQLSRDGRMRNPDEKPILEEPKPAEAEAIPKAVPKQPKEEPKPSPQETVSAQKESKNKGIDLKSKPDIKDSAVTDEYEFENPKKATPAKEPEIDPAKLKEMKREEEILKAKQALERKKKLADKAAAKAAIRAQKEAEKKLKVIQLFSSLCHSIIIHFPKPETGFYRTVRRKQRRKLRVLEWLPTLRMNQKMMLLRLLNQKRLTMTFNLLLLL